jgi:hypothetical protein
MHTVTPWAERWEASIEADLLFDDEGLEVEFDFSNLMRGDSSARAAFYHAGILDGWMTRNEARIAENMNPIDGLDEPLRPLNMVEESWAEEEIEEDPTETITQSPDHESQEEAMVRQRLRAVVSAVGARIARKEALALTRAHERGGNVAEAVRTFYAGHAGYVADSLGVSVDVARAHCEHMLKTLNAKGIHDPMATLEQLALASLVGIGNDDIYKKE